MPWDWLAGLDLRLDATRSSALWFLPFAVPIAFYVAWNDMRVMKIPNRMVLLLAGCFVVIGLLALPLPDYGWRLAQMLGVLIVGFILNQFGGFGAGDAKFAAAAAPFIAPGDARLVVLLFATVLLAAFATHRLARSVPAIRGAAPGWESWHRRDFPMGLALSGTLVFYLILVALYGRTGA